MKLVKPMTAVAAAGATLIASFMATYPAEAATFKSANSSIVSSVSVDSPRMELIEATSTGFIANIHNAYTVKKQDGSVEIANNAGSVAILQSKIHLSDGAERSIDYQLVDNKIIAKYDSAIAPADAPQEMSFRAAQGDPVVCGLSAVGAAGAFVGAVGAAITAPATLGGGLVVSGAALGSAAAAGNAAYQCFKE